MTRLAVAFLCLTVLAVPLAGDAQQPASLPRIGFLAPGSLSDPRFPRFVQAFRQGLRELGYVEGQNIAIEFRWAEGKYDRLPGLAVELVRLKVNVIVAGGSPAVLAASTRQRRSPSSWWGPLTRWRPDSSPASRAQEEISPGCP
jgi:ABC-type uncharacterized transport system substrate-binding protein